MAVFSSVEGEHAADYVYILNVDSEKILKFRKRGVLGRDSSIHPYIHMHAHMHARARTYTHTCINDYVDGKVTVRAWMLNTLL